LVISFKTARFFNESTPRNGIATTTEININAKKLTRITNIENMSCENGFISLKAVKAIFNNFATKIVFWGEDKKMGWLQFKKQLPQIHSLRKSSANLRQQYC
jgi:hypothetical protein